MPELIFCLAAENAVTDSTTNLLSAINIIERITAPALPAIHQKLIIICFWKKRAPITEVEHFSFRLIVKFTSIGETLEKDSLEAEIPSGKDKLRTLIQLEGLPLKQEEEIEFVVEMQENDTWKEVGKYPIDVKKQIA